MSAAAEASFPPGRPAAAVSGEAYRQAMRRFGAAVSVVTTRCGPVRNGLTATAVMSLTAEPPRLAVAVNHGASAFAMLRDSGVFAVNVLRHDQAWIAERFAGVGGVKGEVRFDDALWVDDVTGAPVLEPCAAAFDCRIERVIEIGTHSLLIGAVQSVRIGPGGRPLLHIEGGWASLIGPGEPGGEASRPAASAGGRGGEGEGR